MVFISKPVPASEMGVYIFGVYKVSQATMNAYE